MSETPRGTNKNKQPDDCDDHFNEQDDDAPKREADPLVATPPERTHRRQTFHFPTIKLPSRNKQQKAPDPIMQLYSHAGLIVLVRTAIAIAVIGITGAMFSRKVRGAPAVAVAFSMAVGCLNIPLCCLRPWPRKPHKYKPNILYVVTAALVASLWIVAVVITFYMASKGQRWVFEQTYHPKTDKRGFVYHSHGKPMTAEQAARTIWPHLIGTGALDSVALLLEIGHIYCISRLYAAKFSAVNVAKGLKGIEETLEK